MKIDLEYDADYWIVFTVILCTLALMLVAMLKTTCG